MKLKNWKRAGALLLAFGMAGALVGCGSSTESEEAATAESAETAEVEENTETEESTEAEESTEVDESEYDYLAEFSYSDGFDENGYLTGVTALDYVTLADDYDDLTIDAALGEVTDEEVSEYISENVLANFATTNEITDRAAEDGDTVNIDFVGSIDGVEFDGGNSGGSGYELVLGSGSFIDDFEDQIVGHTPGETFDVTVTFPEDFGNEDLNGKEAVFETTLNYISESVTPDLSDDWVAENLAPTMDIETVDELNAFVKDTMLFDNQSSDVYTALKEKATFADELPESVQTYYRNVVLYDLYLYAQNYGVSMTTLATASGYDTIEDYVSAMQDSIDSMAQQALLFQAIAETRGVVCDTETMNAEFGRYFGTTDPSSYVSAYGESYVKMNVLQTSIMQDLIDNVKYE